MGHCMNFSTALRILVKKEENIAKNFYRDREWESRVPSIVYFVCYSPIQDFAL